MFTPEAIAAIRKAMGLSVADFAMLIGVDRNTVYDWESGRRHPRYEKLVKLNQLVKRTQVSVS